MKFFRKFGPCDGRSQHLESREFQTGNIRIKGKIRGKGGYSEAGKGRIGLKGTGPDYDWLYLWFTAILSPGVGVGQDAWVAQTIGLGLALIVVWVNTLLLARFPGQTFIEINEGIPALMQENLSHYFFFGTYSI